MDKDNEDFEKWDGSIPSFEMWKAWKFYEQKHKESLKTPKEMYGDENRRRDLGELVCDGGDE